MELTPIEGECFDLLESKPSNSSVKIDLEFQKNVREIFKSMRSDPKKESETKRVKENIPVSNTYLEQLKFISQVF